MENYKILNNAFRKNGIQKNLDVDKLVKCRLLDNTEMCQWIKKYFELHFSGQDYDPVARRGGQDLYYIMGGNKVANMPKAGQRTFGQPAAASGRPATAT
jgi:RP/EB family microtubule-associated protein